MERLPVNGGSIAWRQTGEGQRTIVWVHGLPLDSRAWALQENHFRGRASNILLDLRGYGQSDKLPSHVDDITQLYVDDLHSLITHLNCTNAVLVGFASAGHVVLRYAAQHPDAVGDLVSINGSPRFMRGGDWPWGFDEEGITRFTDLAGSGIQAMTDAILDPVAVFQDLDIETAACVRAWFGPMSVNAGVRTLLGFFEGMSRDDDRLLLSGIKARTLLIAGALGREVPADVALYMRQHIRKARLAELPGVDHFAFVSRPELVNGLVEELL